MDKKTTGYVLSVVGIVNIILLYRIDKNIIPFMSFLTLSAYGIFLLSKEDTPIKTLFDKIKSYKNVLSQNNSINPNESSNETLRSSKLNYIALGAAGLAAISVFLPWVEASSSASIGGYYSSYSTGGISGISIGGGIFGLLVALAGGFMAFKNIKFAFIAGAVNFLNGLGYMLGWFGAGGGGSYSSSYGGGYAKASVDPQIGLYLFVLASLVFVIFTLKNLKGEKTE
jgi:hypothetical protein